MSWRFWKNNKKSDLIEEHLGKYDNKFQEMNERIENNGDLIQKSLRLQYKSNQETLKKLEQINERIEHEFDYSKKYFESKKEKDTLIRQRNYISNRYIKWLDDIDLIYNKLNSQEEYWILLLDNWRKQILESLRVVGIYEIDVLGKSFIPSIAESIGTKKREENIEYMPYEVVDVIERGFIFEDGTLLRKAKVITIEEENNKENEE